MYFKGAILRLVFGVSIALYFGINQARPASLQVVTADLPSDVASLLGSRRLASETKLDIVIALPLRNTEALTNLLDEIYNPASAHYRRYLTPEEFAERFGPTQRDYDAVKRFAEEHQLKITGNHPNRTLLNVTATAEVIERTFNVLLQTYPHPTESREFYCPDKRPSVDLAVPLLEICGLSDFHRAQPLFQELALDSAIPDVGSGPAGTYLGDDFRAAYLPGVTNLGHGQRVGLFQLDGYYANDPAQYAVLAGLTNSVALTTLSNVLVGGFDGTPGPNNVEVALDIEMVMSMSPGAQILVYMAANNPAGIMNVLNRMATDNLALQLSASWSFPTGPATVQVFQQMLGQGQTFFNSSGDRGAYGSPVPGPKDVPYVTVVSGTTLTTTGPKGSWLDETVWNVGNGTASGGGVSQTYPIPDWQKYVNYSTNRASATMRNSPDVAMVANYVYAVTDNGVQRALAGTSVAAPLWAGFNAVVNQKGAQQGKPPVGFINPVLYTIGKGSDYAASFRDVTVGNNTTSSSPTNYFAVPRFDLCTGWGSPQPGLIDALLNTEWVPLFGWTLTMATSSGWRSVASSANGKILVAVSGGAPYVSTTSGLTWRTLGPIGSWNGVGCSADGSKMVGAAPFGPIARSTDYGWTWSPTTAPDYFWASAGSSADGTKLVAGTVWEGVVMASTNSGDNWYATAFPGGGGDLAWSADGEVLVVSSAGPSFYVSTNNGLTCYAASLPGVMCQAVAISADGSTLAAAGNAGICISTNLGRPWVLTSAPAQDWSAIACSADGFRFIATVSGGSIYTSDDRGVTWIKRGPRDAMWSSVACSTDGTKIVAVVDNYLDGPIYTGVFPRRPAIRTSSGNLEVNIGEVAVFSADVVGSPPFNCQWRFGGTNIGGATNLSLTISNSQLADAGQYSLVVGNAYGFATSSTAGLKVYLPVPPSFVTQPSNQIAQAGDAAAFFAAAEGFVPLRYQWFFNHTNLLGGQTNQHLVLANAQPNQQGHYTLRATNIYGSATSSPASLIVTPLPICAPLAAGMIGWWKGESSAADFLGRNHGELHGPIGFEPGVVGKSFLFDGANTYVKVPASPEMDVGQASGFTIETWIVPETYIQQGICGWNNVDGSVSGMGVRLQLNEAGLGSVTAVLVDANVDAHFLRTTNGAVEIDKPQHVALTYDRTNGQGVLYVNGAQMDAVNLDPLFVPQTSFDFYLGAADFFFGAGWLFQGKIDEFGLYQRALSAGEVRSIFESGSSGKCMDSLAIIRHPTIRTVNAGSNTTFEVIATGTSAISYFWRKDGTPLVNTMRVSGVNADHLTINNVWPADQGQYSVVVSNSSGVLVSSNASLLVALTQPLRFDSVIALPDGAITGMLLGDAIPVYVEASTNLVNWDIVASLLLTNGAAQFTDGTANQHPRRFYRARVQ